MRQLTPADLYEIVMTKPPAVPVPVKVTTLGPTDIVAEVMAVLEKLKEIKAFLEEEEKKPQEERTFKWPDQRLFYMLGTLDRILRWAETFMDLRKQMAELIGFEVWRKEFSLYHRICNGLSFHAALRSRRRSAVAFCTLRSRYS